MQSKCRLSLRSILVSSWSRSFATDGRQRLSNQFLPLTKESTLAYTENASTSHAYLLQAGFIRQSSSGIYSLLPLGLRTIEKVERIIEEEMNAIGGQKLMLPMLLQSEHWKETGRWNTSKGEFFRLKDRKGADMLLAPTHEEEITSLVASELRSVKQLPIRLYQIGRKYRDELRPRAGLLRGREFIMKDLYSFDKSTEDAFATYDQVSQAYRNVFQRIGIPFIVAEADSGNIGGSKSHEYHLVSAMGEDTLLTCRECGYTANEELAEATYLQPDNTNVIDNTALQCIDPASPSELHTTALTFTAQAGIDQSKAVTTGLVAVVTPHERSANLLKVHAALGKYLEDNGTISDRATMEFNAATPNQWKTMKQQGKSVHVFLDDAVKYTGNTSSATSLILHNKGHFRLAAAGDECRHCQSSSSSSSSLESVKAIEVAHTFYLGTKYSSVLGCTFQDHTLSVSSTSERTKAAEMGCYGIGISRLMAAVADSRTDDRGLVWPSSVAPYRACIIATDDKREKFATMANALYDQINGTTGWANNIVMDDRRAGFGRKMTDAEMIGYPWIVVIGRKAFSESPMIEIHQRRLHAPNLKEDIALAELDQWLKKNQH